MSIPSPSRGRRVSALEVALIVLPVLACAPAPGPGGEGGAPPGLPALPLPPGVEAFTDEAEAAGLDFVHFNGMTGECYFAENMGSGVALFDYDNDGDLDVFLVQGAMLDPDTPPTEALRPPRGPVRDRLFRNDLEPGDGPDRSLRFTDVTEASGLDSTGYGMGVAAGDFDNDGWTDLYVTNHGRNRMFRNLGDGTFEDVTDRAGTGVPEYSASAAFLDYDNDGWLDLFVCNYVDFRLANHKACFNWAGVLDYCAPDAYAPLPDRLFRNRGDGTFEDVSLPSGIAREKGAGLGVVTSDLNDDGHVDILVTNDGMPNHLWLSRGDGTFRNEALMAGVAVNADGKSEASMGVDLADFDGDGDEDLFMTHLRFETNTLYVNQGDATFSDRTTRTGLGTASQGYTGFGTAWLDFNNDGWLDLFVANGAVRFIEEQLAAGDPYALHQSNQLFLNLGDGRFEEVSESAGGVFSLSEVSRGAAFGDLDNDGDVDLVVSNNAGPVRLLLNHVGRRNHWLGLRLVGERWPRDMLGARVEVILADGATIRKRARSDASYCSANDPRVLVGLGETSEIERVRVRWPGGGTETWDAIEADRWILLREGTGRAEP